MSSIREREAESDEEKPVSANVADTGAKSNKVAMLIVFGCCLVVALSIYLMVSVNSESNHNGPAFNYEELVADYRGAGIEVAGSEDDLHIESAPDTIESYVHQAELVTALESEVIALTMAIEMLHSSVDEIIGRMSESQRDMAALTKLFEEQSRLYRQQGELVREGLRTGTMNHQLIRQLDERVNAVDEKISSEFARFPIFVWSVSSWGGQLYVAVSHADAPRNMSELAEGEMFHGWKVEHLSNHRIIFRDGETLHEVTL